MHLISYFVIDSSCYCQVCFAILFCFIFYINCSFSSFKTLVSKLQYVFNRDFIAVFDIITFSSHYFVLFLTTLCTYHILLCKCINIWVQSCSIHLNLAITIRDITSISYLIQNHPHICLTNTIKWTFKVMKNKNDVYHYKKWEQILTVGSY